MNPTTTLPKVLAMLRSRAWSYHKKTGVPFDELFSEAYVGFLQACEKFERKHISKSKFSSWCYTKVTYHLIHYLREKFSDKLVLIEDLYKAGDAPPEASCPPAAFRNSLHEQTKDLSPEARRMIQILINTPTPDGDVIPRQILREAAEEMAFEGYDHVHTQIAIHEIKSALVVK
jgi:DNA-directed RNA polymerase specialized sigma24 family protein